MGFRLDFKPELFELMPRVEEIPFDSDRKLMTTVHKVSDKKYMVYTKGGVDELLARCNSYVIKGKVLTDIDKYASASKFTLIPDATKLQGYDVAVKIAISNITIDTALKISDFKYDL